MVDRRRRALRLAVIAAALLVTAGTALGESIGIHAKVTFTKVGYEYRNVELSVVRSGRSFSWHLERAYFTRPKLHVRDLDADGEPEVWVDTYSGGAHCCDESRFFHYVPATKRYATTHHDWGNVSYRLQDVGADGRPELVSSDDRFAYVFTSFAGSFFPLQIWRFDHGRVTDVTRSFPARTQHDAAKLWKTYLSLRREKIEPRGVLAAWMADEYLLGREQGGWARLDAAYRRGELGPRPDLAGWPQGRAYLRALKAYLRKLGYAGG